MPQPPKQPFLNPPPNGEFPRLIFEWPVRLRQRRFGVGCVHLGYRISTSPLAREVPILVADQQPATLPSPATATWHSHLVHGRAINPLRPAMAEFDLCAHTRSSAPSHNQHDPKTSAQLIANSAIVSPSSTWWFNHRLMASFTAPETKPAHCRDDKRSLV